MSKEILQDIIEDFQPDKFLNFFREKNRNFRPRREELKEYDDEFFISGEKIGDIEFDTANMLFACFKCKDDLTERSSKKLQYEKARKVLKGLSYDSGIFVFYDKSGNFRFSLIYTNYSGKRDWSNYKRFTYYVSKERTNKTFKSRIGESKFDNYEAIKEAFSVDKVTKEFYTDIANWYFWAVDNVEFPEQAEEITDGRKIAVLRLITRLIFIWFMRELKLIPKELFMQENVEEDLKDTSEDESTYYKAILQNLFFATLSTPKEQRQFTDEVRGIKGHNKDFGNHSAFRYQELFKNPEKLKSLFGDIPYLNGGLFECLDNKEERIYIDGFSRTKKNQPTVQNYLFFAKEHKEDLNNWYGTDGKNYNVRGLLDILSSYNFTTDENSSDDSDVALDPELLGKVFENLLASFNPETSTTARKATGSFYTPREIVDYMVTESLKEYFKTHLTQIEDLDVKLESLFNKSATDNPFSSKESRILVQLIENVRIVDPAVGSGAFPMGILNKLVFILNKVDSGNKLWKEAQLKSVESMPDSTLREQTKKHIEKYFTEKNHDYGRKLYLIQKCIYGVDIQQIAVEIAKLRFFIALLVDEKIDKTEVDNWGIEPLPNLDFKIMQGNSLLEEYEGVKLFDEKLFIEDNTSGKSHLDLLKESRSQIQKELMELRRNKKLTKFKEIELFEKASSITKKIKSYSGKEKSDEYENDIFDTRKESIEKRDELKKLHQKFFETSSKESKDELRKQIEKVEWELIEETLISQGKNSALPKLKKIIQENSKPFFLWKLHFADVFEHGGFNIVIGNPPYVDSENMVKHFPNLRETISRIYSTTKGNWDLYIAFYEIAFKLLRKNGFAIYITPNKWLSAPYGKELRNYLRNYFIKLINCSKVKVFEAGNTPVIFSFGYNSKSKSVYEYDENWQIKFVSELNTENLIEENWGALLSTNLFLISHLNLFFEKLGSIFTAENPFSTSEAYILTEIVEEKNREKNVFKLITTGTIDPFESLWGKKITSYLKSKYQFPVVSKNKFKSLLPKRFVQQNSSKIVISGMRYFEAFYDEEGEFLSSKSTLIIKSIENKVFGYSLLGLLNSKLISFYLKQSYSALGIDGGISFSKDMVENLPVYSKFPNTQISNISEYICVVKNYYGSNNISEKFEYLINAMVSELYFAESVKEVKAEVIELVKKQIPGISNIEDKDKKVRNDREGL